MVVGVVGFDIFTVTIVAKKDKLQACAGFQLYVKENCLMELTSKRSGCCEGDEEQEYRELQTEILHADSRGRRIYYHRFPTVGSLLVGFGSGRRQRVVCSTESLEGQGAYFGTKS